jgi:hypothetical protein
MTIRALAATQWLDADPQDFRADFDRNLITFTHRLVGHPLFAPERLLQLAGLLAKSYPADLYYDAGEVAIGQRWDEIGKDWPVDVLMNQIETAKAWIVLRAAERDPEYKTLLEDCLNEISELAGQDFSKVMKLQNAIIFMNSPNRVTSYHIDRECNCLLQIRGSKTVHVFDRKDREVLPESEIEQFWAVDNNAPIYKPQFENRATIVELTPGDGLHIPVNSPHWVKNGPEVSISLSINFHYRDAILGDIYRCNYWMRRCGFQPRPPLQSPFQDDMKRAVCKPFRSSRAVAKEVVRKIRSALSPINATTIRTLGSACPPASPSSPAAPSASPSASSSPSSKL